MQNKIKEFFDDKARNWDLHEKKDKEYFINFVSENIKINRNDKILDLACGTGVITNILASKTDNNVLAIDLSDKMIEVALSKENKTNVRFKAIDFFDLEENKFDLIVCHNAYPHFLDKKLFKNKAYSLLNENGRLIICHSISKEDVNRCHHDKFDVSTKLKDVESEANNFKDLFQFVRLFEDNNIYIIELMKK